MTNKGTVRIARHWAGTTANDAENIIQHQHSFRRKDDAKVFSLIVSVLYKDFHRSFVDCDNQPQISPTAVTS
jgi:hypothetical protein